MPEQPSVPPHPPLPETLIGVRLVLPAWADSDLAQTIPAALGEAGCPGIRLVDGAAALHEGYEAGPMIVVGSLNDNPVMRDLYLRRVAFIDAWFPGEAGHVVRWMHVPAALPHPVLLVGGSTPEGTRRAIWVLLDAVTAGKWLLPPAETRLVPPAPDAERRAAIIRDDVKGRIDVGGAFGPMALVGEWLFLYGLTGHPDWGTLAHDGLLEFIEGYARFQSFGPYLRGELEFYFGWPFIAGWRVVEADPIFSEDDRKKVHGLIKTWGDLTSHATYLQPGANVPGEIRQNHAVSAAISMLELHDYARAHMDVSAWQSAVEQARNVIDGQLSSYRSNDDGGNDVYAFLTVTETMHYRLQRGDLRLFESGQVARMADLAILVTDNCRNEVSYGDSVIYQDWKDLFLVRRLHALGPAAWHYRDGAYQWVYEWLDSSRLPGGPSSLEPLAGRLDSTIMRYEGDVESVYPVGYCGVSALLLDEGALHSVDNWYADPGHAGQAPYGTRPRPSDDRPLPIDYARWRPKADVRYFDKISFRPSFDPEDEYLLLQGPGTFAHGHRDANGIARLAWKDRIWLVDLDYVRATPQHHNVVYVVRDGHGAAYPPLASMERLCNFPSVGISRTVLREYNGTEWYRTIIWLQGRGFVVLDDLDVKEGGEYQIECLWRTLGETNLADGRLDVEQAGLTLSIVGVGPESSQRSLGRTLSARSWVDVVRFSRESILDRYPYASPDVRVLHQRQNGRLEPGQRISFGNLLSAPASGRLPVAGLTKLTNGLLRANLENATSLVGTPCGPVKAGNVTIEAEALYWEAARLCLTGCTRLVVGGCSLISAEPCDVDIHLDALSASIFLPADCESVPVATGWALVSPSPVAGSAVKPPTVCFSVECDQPIASQISAAFFVLAQAVEEPVDPADLTATPPQAQPVWRRSGPAPVTACAVLGDLRIFGTSSGQVFACDSSGQTVWEVGLGAPVRSLAAVDLIGSGELQVAASTDGFADLGTARLRAFLHVSPSSSADSPARVHLISGRGELRWSSTLDNPRLFGDVRRVMALAELPVDGGQRLLLAAADAVRVYAFKADGTPAWQDSGWVKYHGLTALAVGDLLGTGELRVIVGTEYQTPINVLDRDGKRLWYTWEQVGSEHRSSTVRSGTDVRALRLADVNQDGRLEIIYGTGDLQVLALDPRDGRHVWKADVGGEVVGLEVVQSVAGGLEIAAATDNGLVWRLGADGAPLAHRCLDHALSALVAGPSGELAVAGTAGIWLLAADLESIACVGTSTAAQLSRIASAAGPGCLYAAGNEWGEILFPV